MAPEIWLVGLVLVVFLSLRVVTAVLRTLSAVVLATAVVMYFSGTGLDAAVAYFTDLLVKLG